MKTENFSSETSLDAIDLALLKALQANAKMSSKELAASVGLSITPTYERIKRLERRGVIQGYTVQLDAKKMGFELEVLCNISLKLHSKEMIEAFEMEIIKLKEVLQVYHVAGNFDYLLHIQAEDMDSYSHFLKHKLASIPNIAQVQSSFVMDSLI